MASNSNWHQCPSSQTMNGSYRSNAALHSDRVEHLSTNHFHCSFSDNIPLYQYDVTVEGFNSVTNQWFEIGGRWRCSQIVDLITREHQLDEKVFVWYDQQKCLYSTSLLKTPDIRYCENQSSRLQIKSLSNQYSTNDVNEYIAEDSVRCYPHDAIRTLGILLKRSIDDRIKIINKTCYFLNGASEPSRDGFIKRYGFVQALNLAQQYLTLNIDIKSAKFYPAIPLLDFIYQRIGEKRIPTNDECEYLNQLLHTCHIVTKQSNWRKAYVFEQFDYRRPAKITTESGQPLTEYYLEKYGIDLDEHDFPCIKVLDENNQNESCYLPVELCRIKEWQIYQEPILAASIDGEQTLTPTNRYHKIMEVIRKCGLQSVTNVLCHAVGFKIDTRNMLELDARILAQPKMYSREGVPTNIVKEHIYLNRLLYEPKPIVNLIITCFGTYNRKDKEMADIFATKLLEVMETLKISLRKVKRSTDPVNDIQTIDSHFRAMKEARITFVVCIMHANNQHDLAQLKKIIKTCAKLKYGMRTQSVLLSNIPKDARRLRTYCENVVRQINYKNGGLNVKLNLDDILKKRSTKPNSFMFFGADVIHPTNVSYDHPSIAVIVGSNDSSCSRTAVSISKQYPKVGKCAVETILGMTEMVQQRLLCFQNVNGYLPENIVFYRDGVDVGQFRNIDDFEIPALRQAFTNIYGQEHNHPKLTFVVVSKRHHTRFFLQSNSESDRRSRQPGPTINNMSIGAVVDTTIVQSDRINFYLNAHRAIQGVNRAPHYHVLLNEIGFTKNELQLLTFYLCFADQISSAVEAIPSIVHQADYEALNARDLFCNNEYLSQLDNDANNRSNQNIPPNELTYEILSYCENL